jgi:diguanylate cyclase
MLNRLKSILRSTGSTNRKTLLWGTIIALVVGVLGILTPVDMTMRLVRQKLLTHPASGDIVVVGIDDKSLVELGDWPWNRGIHAKLINELNRLGAKRIVFDFTLPKYSGDSGDQQLVEAMRNAKGKVFTSARHAIDKQSGRRDDEMPAEPFSRYAGTTSLFIKENGFGNVWKLPIADVVNGKKIDTISAKLAGISDGSLVSYDVDYAVDFSTIKSFSAIDVLSNKIPKQDIYGRSVIVGLTSTVLGDIKPIPGHGQWPGAYLHVAGAETLKRGMPNFLGWFIPFCLTLLLVAGGVFAPHRSVARALLLIGLNTI